MKETKMNMNVPSKNIPQFRLFKLTLGQLLIERNTTKEPIYDSEDEDVGVDLNHPFGDRRCRADPTPERRTQEAAHLPEVKKGIQKRCALDKCKMKSTVFCIKCNVYLCLVDGRNCFRKYHTKQ